MKSGILKCKQAFWEKTFSNWYVTLSLQEVTTFGKLPNIKILVKNLKSSNFLSSERLHKPTSWLLRYQNCRSYMYPELESQKRTIFKRNILLLLVYFKGYLNRNQTWTGNQKQLYCLQWEANSNDGLFPSTNPRHKCVMFTRNVLFYAVLGAFHLPLSLVLTIFSVTQNVLHFQELRSNQTLPIFSLKKPLYFNRAFFKGSQTYPWGNTHISYCQNASQNIREKLYFCNKAAYMQSLDKKTNFFFSVSSSLFKKILYVTDFASLSQACFSFWRSAESCFWDWKASLLCGDLGEQIIPWQKELALLAIFPNSMIYLCSGIPQSLTQETSENNWQSPKQLRKLMHVHHATKNYSHSRNKYVWETDTRKELFSIKSCDGWMIPGQSSPFSFQQGHTTFLTGIKTGQIPNLDINACKSNKNIHQLWKKNQWKMLQ